MIDSIKEIWKSIRKQFLLRKKRKAINVFGKAKADLKEFVENANDEINTRHDSVNRKHAEISVFVEKKKEEIEDEREEIQEVVREQDNALRVINELNKFTL